MSTYYNGSQDREWPGSEEDPDWTPPADEIQNLSVLKMAGYEPWCFTCDRPKSDCACIENGGTY